MGGAGQREKLRAKAEKLWGSSAISENKNPLAALFNAQLIDVAVTYCSASDVVTKETIGDVALA